MTIALSANTPRVSYTVNAGATQTAFTVNFEFFDDADLNFYVDGTKKTLTTHYTVSGGNGSTGTINTTSGNTVTGASGGSTIVITRSIAFARVTDFPSSGAFQVATLNTELDRFTAIASDISDETTRSIQLADEDSAVSMELPLLASRKGTVLGFNASTGAVEAGPTITAVQSLSAVTASINLLGTSAVVEDMGLLATSAVIEDMGLLGTSGNVTAMGLLGVSGVITDMGILGTTAIVEDMGFLGTSANVTAMGHLGTSANVTAMGKLGNDATVADMAILGTDDVVADMNTLATSDIIADLNTLATSDIVTDMNLLATSANVTAMGILGTSANVTAMGLLGTSAVVTDLNLLATSAVIEDMGLLATSAVIEDMGLLATSAVIEDMGLLATSAVIEDMGLLATSVVIEDMGLLATSANITNMATLGASGVVGNIATVATGISGVNAFAERYRVGSSDPSSSNDAGDLFFNTSDNTFKFFNGSSYVAVNVSGIDNLVEDTSPQLGGDLDVQTNSIVSTSNRNIAITPNGSGKVVLDGLSYPTSDGSNGQFLKTDGSGVLSFATVDLSTLSPIAGSSSIVTTGALNAGSITSGFGNIDTGSSTITTTGTVTTGALSAKGGAVFNEDSADVDFRVESNDDANIFRIEGATNNVKIGSNAGNYGQLSIKNEKAGSQERGLYVEVTPASGTSPNNVAVFSATNSNMTQPLVRIHHESPTADQLLLQATTTGSNTVKFSVDEDGDIYSAGGINLGGTGTANKLDDYEEGTFTPILQNSGGVQVGAYSLQTGFYTKVGRVVHANGVVSANGLGSSGSGNGIFLGGLPFDSFSGSNNGSPILISHAVNLNIVAGSSIGGFLPANSTNVQLFIAKQTQGSASFSFGELSSDGQLTYSITYQAT